MANMYGDYITPNFVWISLNELLSPKIHQFLYISSILPSLINQFHFNKSDMPLIRHIPVEKISMFKVQSRKFWGSKWPSKVGASSLMLYKFIPSGLSWALYLGVWFSGRGPFSLTFLVVSRSSRSKHSLLLLNSCSTLLYRVDKSSKSFVMLAILKSI